MRRSTSLAGCLRRCVPTVLSGLLLMFGLAVSANCVSYTLVIGLSGDAAVDALAAASSRLASLRDTGPVPPLALISRAEADVDRFDTLLRSFGYYDALIDIRIAAMGLDDPRMLPLLEAQPAAGAVPVAVTLDPGPLYRLGQVRLDGPVPGPARAAFDLRPGAPARAADVLAAGEAMLSALREEGFALATMDMPDVLVDHDTRTMDVTYRAQPGPRLAIGEVRVIGLERLREGFVLRRLGLVAGEPYRPSRLEAARRDLMQTGVLAWARLTPGTEPDGRGRLPLTLELAERPRRVIRWTGAYSSDLGATLSASWVHRNLFGGAERLELIGEVSGLSAARGEPRGYLSQANLTIPDLVRRNLDLSLRLGAVSEDLDAYDRDALMAGPALQWRVSDRLALSAGLGYERSRITQSGVTGDYRLLSLPLNLSYDGADDPLDPHLGVRVTATVSPTRSLAADAGDFVLAQLSAAAYLDMSRALDAEAAAGRRVLAGRVLLGRIAGAAVDRVPPDWRFYAGGGGSVRGYPFQSIGPTGAGGRPTGGTALVEGSLELRQRLRGNWGLAAFVDAGAVSDDGPPDALSVGVGAGVRYFTPIGPIRVDVAAPLDRRPGDASAQLYIGIGQAF